MKGEYTPTIIRVILAMDHTSIQLKYSREIPRFSNTKYPVAMFATYIDFEAFDVQ